MTFNQSQSKVKEILKQTVPSLEYLQENALWDSIWLEEDNHARFSNKEDP